MHSFIPVRLSAPTETLCFPADSSYLYELAFPLADADISRSDDDLVFKFQEGGRIVMSGYYAAGSVRPRFIIDADGLTGKEDKDRDAWTAVPGERGIYRRTGRNGVEYQLRTMRKGRRFTDILGAVPMNEARRVLDILTANRDSGSGPQSYREMRVREGKMREGTLSLKDFRSEFFMPLRRRLSRSGMDTRLMEGRWKNHIEAFFGDMRLDRLSESHFVEYVSLMRSKPGFGDTTILHCLVDLRRIWSCAVKSGALDRPFPGKEAIREITKTLDNEKKCYLTPDEAALLAKTAYERRLRSRMDHDVYCYIVLGLGLRMRAGEIHKLTSQSVERRLIEKTKNGRPRFVHFGFAPVQSMLTERLALYPPDSPRDPLFKALGRNAKSGIRQTVPRKYYDLIRELGFNEKSHRAGQRLEKIDFHALRHTFATLAAMRGVDHLTLMRLMGHKTPAMTLRYIEIADAHQASGQEQAMNGIFPKELEKENFAAQEKTAGQKLPEAPIFNGKPTAARS